MSDKVLQALMQLFAIVANAERLTEQGRGIVESFLRQQLSQSLVLRYLGVFDDYLKSLQGKSDPTKVKKRVSVNSVKVLRICTDINSELNQKQKYVVLIRLIEFAYSSEASLSEQESEFIDLVAETFNISNDEYSDCLSLVIGKRDMQVNSSRFLVLSGNHDDAASADHFLFQEGLNGKLYVFYIRQAGILFTRYFGDLPLTLNGIPVYKNSVYILVQGSVIRGPKIQPVYFSDIMQSFMEDSGNHRLRFTAKNISYVFPNGQTGLYPLSFSITSGNLIGIMGGSGAGKSTLLNVLNSNLKPHTGEVLINGHSIHTHSNPLEGVIGYVPQDDLLMDSLTVFQNIFFNTKLCFGNLGNTEIEKKCDEILESLGLYEIKNLPVGGVLDKTISGGQRKRLNIALELIREPSVLFVDEPTSGLSSRDSENVMDLLKQLAINGKLVFVVIHQPSSDIFKLFDQLLILDIGGYPVYFGNPVDSLVYFKKNAHYADIDDGECFTCGNLNPEQVFSILESKVVDEFGNLTANRKISPEEWNRIYLEQRNLISEFVPDQSIPASPAGKKPSKWKQFMVFIQRDVLSKLKNNQYMLVSMLEAPVLALILAYFLRYASADGYVFRENMNIPVFMFMSVIVALFLGLTVSAEEIIRDRKIRKRESFLNLSLASYLLAKMVVLFTISGIQSMLFILIGNNLLGIPDMIQDYWLVLFSVSCCANVIGLNISSAFNDAVTIYIIIPLVIIPQILMSGILVKFENMNPVVTAKDKVPMIGEVMISQWAFEALAVNQFKGNAYNRLFFEYDKNISLAHYKKDLWLGKLDDKLEEAKNNKDAGNGITIANIKLIKNEIAYESEINPQVPLPDSVLLGQDFSTYFYTEAKHYFSGLNQFYQKAYLNSSRAKEQGFLLMEKQGLNDEALIKLKNSHSNEALDDLVLNTNGLNKITEYNEKLVRSYQPVYMTANPGSFIRAPFYVHEKYAFGKLFSTYCVNLIIIWLMTLIMVIALYFNWLRKLLRIFKISHFAYGR